MPKISFSPFLSLFFIFNIVIIPLAIAKPPPSIFIFGDSILDVGTNTYIPASRARADFPHNGIDFPNSQPTGRFSNGFNTADFIAKSLGFKRSPSPFLFLALKSHFQNKDCKGVNFASGGAGILDITGTELSVVSLTKQIIQFSTVRNNLTALIGSSQTEAMVSKSLFFISVGGNDVFRYFRSDSKVPKENFVANLISLYTNHIKNLYNLGARKFGILGAPLVGCTPHQRLVQKTVNGVDGCFAPSNDFALTLHSAINSNLVEISSQLPGFKYSLVNGYKLTVDIMNKAQTFGFENVDSACCGTGYLRAQGPCNETATLCMDRSKYMFWDLFHPTQKLARLASEMFYNSSVDYVFPINFAQLAKA